jgi:hypothetical protein
MYDEFALDFADETKSKGMAFVSAGLAGTRPGQGGHLLL